jgi:archaellum biogenesis ATPase FlaH
MADLLTNIIQAIILMGLIVLGVWTKRWIDALNGTVTALKGTVDAQSQTISSQKTLLDNLGNVLTAADTPKMLERVDAYKKFVDQEKEPTLTQVKREFTEDKNKNLESAAQSLMYLNEQVTNLVDLVGRLMPFVPPKDRPTLLDSTDFRPRWKDRMVRLAPEAPDLSHPETRRGLAYVGHLTSKKSN